jgi:hypothetical protein
MIQLHRVLVFCARQLRLKPGWDGAENSPLLATSAVSVLGAYIKAASNIALGAGAFIASRLTACRSPNYFEDNTP